MGSDDKSAICVISNIPSLKQEHEFEELDNTLSSSSDYSIKREVPVKNALQESKQPNVTKRRKLNNNREKWITTEHLDQVSDNKRSSEYLKTIENGQKRSLDESELTCRLCTYDAANEWALFKHAVMSHFAIKLHITCQYCVNPAESFNSYESLYLHYEKIHDSFPDLKHHTFQCVMCKIVFPDTDISTHIENHLKFYGIFKTKPCIRKFTDNCAKLALRKANCQIDAVLNKIVNNDLRCSICKDHFFKDALKCNRSGCNRWYHLKCCNIYNNKLDSEKLNPSNAWFCTHCDENELEADLEKNESEILSIDELKHELESLKAYFNNNDITLLNGITGQAALLSEIFTIKKQKVAQLEDFMKIKQFILNAKSNKINNCLSQTLCEQIQKYLTAGVLHIEP